MLRTGAYRGSTNTDHHSPIRSVGTVLAIQAQGDGTKQSRVMFWKVYLQHLIAGIIQSHEIEVPAENFLDYV